MKRKTKAKWNKKKKKGKKKKVKKEKEMTASRKGKWNKQMKNIIYSYSCSVNVFIFMLFHRWSTIKPCPAVASDVRAWTSKLKAKDAVLICFYAFHEYGCASLHLQAHICWLASTIGHCFDVSTEEEKKRRRKTHTQIYWHPASSIQNQP